MIAPRASQTASRVAGFRRRLLVAMMLVVFAVTALGLYVAERNLTAGVERGLQRDFQAELEARHHTEEVRRAALAERCRSLARRPRIQGALEEFPEALYDVAENELSDIREGTDESSPGGTTPVLHAKFYRFLNAQGAVIAPLPKKIPSVGALRSEEEARLALRAEPDRQHNGYLSHLAADGAETVSEIILMPIASNQTHEVIAAIVLGFKPFDFATGRASAAFESGVWFDGRLHLAGRFTSGLAAEVARAIAVSDDPGPLPVSVGGTPHLLFCKRLNPGSLYPPAYEVCLYSLAGLHARQWQLRWQIGGAGGLLLLGGLLASRYLSGRLAEPVEKLAADSERSARFSADASHQLKTPVTVLRAGLEELLAHEHLTPAECHEISALVHQTYRLSTLIEDLLLLSRMDAGALKLEISSVNLTELIEASLDDLSALPDELELQIETDFPATLHIAGEKRYTAIILQNLLENARKYNLRGGRLRLAARTEGDTVLLTVGNTGRAISAEAQAHIFERFHRGAIGENVPGYGLGLNLARELARLHGGDLRLACSDGSWTEFAVRFRPAPSVAVAGATSA